MPRKEFLIHDSVFKGLKVQVTAYKSKEEGLYGKILQIISDIHDYFFDRHSKVLPVRFDLRYPQDFFYSEVNSDIRRFIDRLTQHYRRRGIDTVYLWVREKDKSLHPHYHIAFYLDGHKVQSPYGVVEKAREIWLDVLGIRKDMKIYYGGLVHCCDMDLKAKGIDKYLVRKDRPDYETRRSECFYIISYLAKKYSKMKSVKHQNSYGYSQKIHKKRIA